MGGHREREIMNEEEEEKDEKQEDREYEVTDVRDRIHSSLGSRFNLIENELGIESGNRRMFSRESVINGIRYVSRGLFIHPENR